MNFHGVIPILATPFLDDESLDTSSLSRMIRFFGSMGIRSVTLLGVLGESNRLADSERAMLIAAAVEADSEVSVIVGCSHTGTRAAMVLAREAERLGASAVMIAPTKQPAPNDDAVFEYYRRIADSTTLPVVLQDHPASTEVFMSAAFILRMVKEIPSIAAIKAEAVPSPNKIAVLRKSTELPILTGLGGLYGFFDLERGSDGFNTGFAFPEILLAIVAAAKAHDLDRAYAIYRRYLPLMVFEQQPGLAIRKEILRLRGLIDHARVRHPGGNIDPASAAQLAHLLERTFPGQDLKQTVGVEV